MKTLTAASVMALLLTAGTGLGTARGALKTWDGGGNGTHWNDGANWSPNGVPVNNVDSVVIDGGGGLTVNLTVPAFEKSVPSKAW